ncbi:glycosyltransferase family 4 protein [bacterium]|nr:glycosyltransferase family 4 protein [bacterium]
MKKTLLITLDFWPNFGGVANYYYNLAQNIDDIVILTSTPQNQKSHLKIYSQKLLYKFIWPKWLKTILVTIKTIKKEKIEIIWVGELLPLGTVAYIINKLFKIPYFVSLHGLDIKLAKQNKKKSYLAKKILKNSKFITVNSKCTKNLLRGFISDTDKIKIIYPGINSNFNQIDLEKKEKIQKQYNPDCQKIILTVGRLVKRKNQELIINTIAKFKKELKNVLYLIVGNGPEEKYYKSLITSHELNNNVKILTNINFEDLPYFYDLANIFIMISKLSKSDIEGFGIVYLEAGIFKKPVIAANQGGSLEAILNNRTGILIDDHNKKLLKEKILELLNNKNLSNKLGDNAFQRIQNNFLWKNISKKLIKNINLSR